MLEKGLPQLIERLSAIYSNMEVTPRERGRITARFQEADRVPVTMQIHDHAAPLSGLTVREICTDPSKLYFTQLTALDKYGHDSLISIVDVYNLEAEALGSVLKFPENSIPVIVSHVLKEQKDLDELEFPDPYSDGRMKDQLKVFELHEQSGLNEYIDAGFGCSAPFSMAVGLRGFTSLVFDMAKEPDFAHRIMQFCTDLALEYGKVISGETGKVISYPDAWASFPNISPAQWDEFVLPYITQLLKGMNGKAFLSGVWGLTRYDNDWRKSLRKFIASGSSLLRVYDDDLDRMDLSALKEIALYHKRQYAISLDSELILQSTKKGLTRRIGEFMKEIEPSGGFSINASMIPMGCPPEKVKGFIDVVKEVGRYPFRPSI